MATEQQSPDRSPDKIGLDRSDEQHQIVDPEQLDFDPDDGLYSGTVVDGTSEIPGPHLDQETGEVPGLKKTGVDEPQPEQPKS